MTHRPTFNDSWYRVAQLKPRLRATVQTYRQQYRGRLWHVLADPANNEYFRIDEAAYFFVALLDGQRTVQDAWGSAQQQLGDGAPTQGEAIHLLGRLYVCNLLQADLPPDAAGMFERQRKRRRKEVGGQLLNFLFVRIPLFDPDRFLDRWVKVFGWAFSPVGVMLWALLLVAGLYHLIGRASELAVQATSVLSPANLIWLTISFWLIKAIHEFGHGMACKRFGAVNHTGGEVHTVGLMLMALMPIPYVDASSAWAFRSKWHRFYVAAAGMYVELAVAAIAAIVWANTAAGSTIHAISYNMIFLASVSTLLFNGNPLLRYDAYYMLCDYLETPNLAQRSKDYLYYLIKRYIFGVPKLQDPSHGDGERHWFVPYSVASFVYRIFISVSIILFVADQLFIIGVIMACAAVVTWLLMPIVKFIHYLLTHADLARVRGRAVGSSALTAAALAIMLGGVPMPDRGRAEGIVEPRQLAIIHAAADGFVQSVTPTGRRVTPQDEPLLAAHNPQMLAERAGALADKRLYEAQRRASGDDAVTMQTLSRHIETLERKLTVMDERLAMLQVKAPFEGVWVAPEIEFMQGAYVRRGDQIGVVATVDDLIIRVTADQHLGPRIEPELGTGGEVEIRVKGRPDLRFTGRITRVSPAGQERLPSAALGLFAGGSIGTDASDTSGTRAAESFFEVRIDPNVTAEQVEQLFTGQRVVVRFEMPSRPLAAQGWRALAQVLQRRFQI